MELDFVSVHKNTKRELGQYPAILTLRLVNNIYIMIFLWGKSTKIPSLNEAGYTGEKEATGSSDLNAGFYKEVL